MNTTTAPTTTSTTSSTCTRRIRRLLLAGGLAAAVALGAAACSDGPASSKAAGTNAPLSTLAPKTGVQAGTTTQQPATQPQGQPSSQPTSQPQGQPQGNPAPSAPAPVISSFSTPENIDCHNGNFQTFSASWTTQHAVKTTMSIDGPGVYKTYGPNDGDSLPFNCSSSHSFTLTAYGADGHSVSMTITLQPRNVQSQGTGDDDQ